MFLVFPFRGSQALKVEDTAKLPSMELRPKMTIKGPPMGIFIQKVQSFNFVQNWMRSSVICLFWIQIVQSYLGLRWLRHAYRQECSCRHVYTQGLPYGSYIPVSASWAKSPLSIVQIVEEVVPGVREAGKRPFLLSLLTPLFRFLSLVWSNLCTVLSGPIELLCFPWSAG